MYLQTGAADLRSLEEYHSGQPRLHHPHSDHWWAGLADLVERVRDFLGDIDPDTGYLAD